MLFPDLFCKDRAIRSLGRVVDVCAFALQKIDKTFAASLLPIILLHPFRQKVADEGVIVHGIRLHDFLEADFATFL